MGDAVKIIGQTLVESARRERFSDAAQREFAKFERLEFEFRKKDRKERADELQIPLENIKAN